jgi:CBS domain containing-hemolysin-like protein
MILAVALIFLPLLLTEGFFALAEIALVSANPRRLQRWAQEGRRGADLALKLLRRPERLVATCLLGANLAEICNTVLVTALLLAWLGPKGELVAAVALPPLILLLAEITPKSIARQHPNRLAQRVGLPLWAASWLLAPLTVVFAGASRLVLRLLGAKRRTGLPFITREDLRLVVATSGPEVDLERGERRIIHRILRFSQRRAREVMVPLVKVAAIPDTLTIAQALEEFRTSPFSRLPVYHRRIDNLVGVLHGFDLLGESPSERPIRPLIRPVPYVPEIKKIDGLLTEMQRRGIHLAVVVDEYGGAVGIVTLEDLLEEIVGEIADEFDQEASPLTRVAENRYLIDARMEISALNETLNLNLPLGDYETLAGFLIAQSGDLPRAGQVVEWGGLRFIVRRAEPRAVREVELVLPQSS